MDTALSLVTLAAVALLAGAYYLWRKGGAQQQIWLMIILAMVMLVNVVIWTVPDAGGEAPLERARTAE